MYSRARRSCGGRVGVVKVLPLIRTARQKRKSFLKGQRLALFFLLGSRPTTVSMPVSPFLTFSSSFDDDDGSLFQFERGFPPFLAFLFYLFLSFSLPSVFAFGKMQLSTFVIDRLVVSRAPPAYLVKQEKGREKRQLPPRRFGSCVAKENEPSARGVTTL